MEKLLKYLNRLGPLTQGCSDQLRELLQEKTLRKGEYLLRQGEVCRAAYFIQKGCLRRFYRVEGQEVTTAFIWAEEVYISISSLYKQAPSLLSIQALEDCALLSLPYLSLLYLYGHFLEFNAVMSRLTERNLVAVDREGRQFQTLSAGERYRALWRRHRDVTQRIPAPYLASYLDVPEADLPVLRNLYQLD